MKIHILVRIFLLSPPFNIPFKPLTALGDNLTKFVLNNFTLNNTLHIHARLIRRTQTKFAMSKFAIVSSVDTLDLIF